MKWYPNLIQAVIQALTAIFDDRRQGDKVIVSLLKNNRKWGSRDRRFVSQILYDIIRWKRLYEAVSDSDISTEQGKWKVIAAWAVLHDIPLPEWTEFADLDVEAFHSNYNKIDDPAVLNSVPDWLYNLGKTYFGDEMWQRELQALNEEAPIVLRVNTLKINAKKLAGLLLREGVETKVVQDIQDALILKKRQKITHLRSYKQGLFEIQDASSQLVAPFTGVKEGMTVIDACAGAGGKTLHLAAMMRNTGSIYAYDIYDSKLTELQRRAKRNGVKNLKQIAVFTPEIINNNKEKADILLLDAPCSSLGTLKRKPDLKWKLNLDRIKQINVIQGDILDKYEQMLKPEGTLIYITCSILPQENKEIVNKFLDTHNNYIFVEDRTIYPSTFIGDGFYMAKLIKK